MTQMGLRLFVVSCPLYQGWLEGTPAKTCIFFMLFYFFWGGAKRIVKYPMCGLGMSNPRKATRAGSRVQGSTPPVPSNPNQHDKPSRGTNIELTAGGNIYLRQKSHWATWTDIPQLLVGLGVKRPRHGALNSHAMRKPTIACHWWKGHTPPPN